MKQLFFNLILSQNGQAILLGYVLLNIALIYGIRIVTRAFDGRWDISISILKAQFKAINTIIPIMLILYFLGFLSFDL